MSSAPKDGTEIVLCFAGEVFVRGRWFKGNTESPQPEWEFNIVTSNTEGEEFIFCPRLDEEPIGWLAPAEFES
jgi:hypothetical protein